MYYSVDALENGTARLVDDAGGSAFVPAADLPPGAAQGDVLEHRDGVWSAAPEETKRRKARAARCSRYWSVKTPRAMEALNENCFGD